MSRKKKSKLLIWIEYLAARYALAVIEMMPRDRSIKIARLMADLLYLVDKRHRRIADENLKAAYGEDMSPTERLRVIRDSYRSFVEMGVDAVFFCRFAREETWRDYIWQMEVPDETWALVPDDPGVVFATGHLGNWEVMGLVLALIGYPCHIVARPMDNPLLNDLAQRFREHTGQKLIPHRGVYRMLVGLLHQRKKIALLIDQDARGRGVFAPFFGRPASTYAGAAALALDTGCPIVFGYGRRVGDKPKFHIFAEKPIWPVSTGDRRADIYRITAHLNAVLEREVRRFPDKWFWQHRRWKTRPPEDWTPPEVLSYEEAMNSPDAYIVQPKRGDNG